MYVDADWQPLETRTFALDDIFMATKTAFTVQVALHNAGGYGEAITILPNVPDVPQGMMLRMLEVEAERINSTRVRVQLPSRTNGASVNRMSWTWRSYYDHTLANGFQVHTPMISGLATTAAAHCPANDSVAACARMLCEWCVVMLAVSTGI